MAPGMLIGYNAFHEGEVCRGLIPCRCSGGGLKVFVHFAGLLLQLVIGVKGMVALVLIDFPPPRSGFMGGGARFMGAFVRRDLLIHPPLVVRTIHAVGILLLKEACGLFGCPRRRGQFKAQRSVYLAAMPLDVTFTLPFTG